MMVPRMADAMAQNSDEVAAAEIAAARLSCHVQVNRAASSPGNGESRHGRND